MKLGVHRATIAVPVLLLSAACGGERTGDSGRQVAVPSPPHVVRETCVRVAARAAVTVLCPTALPRLTDRNRTGALRATPLGGRARDRYMIELSHGTPAGDEKRNRPPRFLHVLFAGGALNTFGSPTVDVPPTVPRPRSFGYRCLGRRCGELYLQRPYRAGGGLHANHLIFVWRECRTSYALSLHSWRNRAALELLDALVRTLRPVGS